MLHNLTIAAAARLLAWLLGPEPDYRNDTVGCCFGAQWVTTWSDSPGDALDMLAIEDALNREEWKGDE